MDRFSFPGPYYTESHRRPRGFPSRWDSKAAFRPQLHCEGRQRWPHRRSGQDRRGTEMSLPPYGQLALTRLEDNAEGRRLRSAPFSMRQVDSPASVACLWAHDPKRTSRPREGDYRAHPARFVIDNSRDEARRKRFEKAKALREALAKRKTKQAATSPLRRSSGFFLGALHFASEAHSPQALATCCGVSLTTMVFATTEGVNESAPISQPRLE